MKRIIPILLLFAFITSAVQAQRLNETDDMLDKLVLSVELTGPQMAMLEMKQELKLTEEQEAKLAALNEQRYQDMTDAEANYTDPLQLQRKFREIHVQHDKVLANILSEQQLKQYLELEGRQHINLLSGKEGEE